MIIVHAEATGDVKTALMQIRQAGIMAGLALLKRQFRERLRN